MKIPFNKSAFVGKELFYLKDVISRGHTSGDGIYTKACNNLFEQEIGVKKSLMTTSCTHALEMVALLLNIKPGDEVILPSFTFVSTVNAFVLRGATPVFCDIRPDTLNMDENIIESLITKNTKVIVPVHYAGVGCEMDRIMEISKKYSVHVIEDNAHGLFGKYKDKYLGTFGSFGTQSFHETKNFSCGEGGALLINDDNFIEKAEIIREKGTDRSKFFRGQVDKYSWVEIGSSYLPSDMLAAFLYDQLERKDQIQKLRMNIWNYYYEALNSWAKDNNIGLPNVPDYCNQTYHMFYLIMPSNSSRNKLMKNLSDNGIMSVFHYLPLHSSKMGKKINADKYPCPVTEDISSRILRLPFFNDLKINDMDYIISHLKNFSV